MTATLEPTKESDTVHDPIPCMQAVLPDESPIEMPHQDLAISPVMMRFSRWLRWPGTLLRSILSFRHRKSAGG